MPIPKADKKYTYADYLSWPDDEHYEIIDGIPYLMTAPTWEHQSISAGLFRQFDAYLQGKTCKIFFSPFDVRLPKQGQTDEEATHVLQPDLTVICDRFKLKGTGYFGTPDLIIEIISPSSAKQDRVLKFNTYESAGVAEYWIVDPDGKFISVFILCNGRYGRPENYNEDERIAVHIFPDLVVDLNRVFEGI